MPTALTWSYWDEHVHDPTNLLYPGPNILYIKNPFQFFPFSRFLLTENDGSVQDVFPNHSPGMRLTKSMFSRLLQILYAKHINNSVSGDITCPVATPFKTSYWNEFVTWAQEVLTDFTSPIYRSYVCNSNGFQFIGETVLLTNMANTALSLLPANVRSEVNQLVNMYVYATRLVGLPGVASLGSVGVSGGNVTSSLGFPTFTDLFGFPESQVETGGFVSVAKTPHFDFAVLSASDLTLVNALEPMSIQGSSIGPFALYPEQPAVGLVLPFDCA